MVDVNEVISESAQSRDQLRERQVYCRQVNAVAGPVILEATVKTPHIKRQQESGAALADAPQALRFFRLPPS